MGLINKDERQSVFDFILEKTGAISGLFEFLNKNNLTDVDVPAGEYLVNDVVKEEVVNFFAGIAPEVSIATGTVTILGGSVFVEAKNSNGVVVASKMVNAIDNVVNVSDSDISVAGVVVGSLPSGDSLNIVTTDQNDVPIVPISGTVSGGVATVKIPTALEILIPYKILDGSAGIVVVTDSEGTIDTIDSTGLFAFTIAVNSTPVTVPFTLAVGDVMNFTFTASTIDGNIKLNGYA